MFDCNYQYTKLKFESETMIMRLDINYAQVITDLEAYSFWHVCLSSKTLTFECLVLRLSFTYPCEENFLVAEIFTAIRGYQCFSNTSSCFVFIAATLKNK